MILVNVKHGDLIEVLLRIFMYRTFTDHQPHRLLVVWRSQILETRFARNRTGQWMLF